MRFNCQNAFDIWEPRLIEMHVYAYACNYNTCTVLRMNIFPINLTILTFLTFVTFVPLFEKSANKFKLRNIFRLHSHFNWRDMRVYLLFNCKLDLFGCELTLQPVQVIHFKNVSHFNTIIFITIVIRKLLRRNTLNS